MTVTFFTEAGQRFGYGHLFRCLSLAQALAEEGGIPRFYVQGDKAAADLIPPDWLEDVAPWWEACDRYRPRLEREEGWLVIDSYHAPGCWYTWAPRTVVFDDENRLTYGRGLVLNASLYASRLDYPPECAARAYLLGPSWQMLRRAFWQPAPAEHQGPVRNLFLSLGGGDPHGMMPHLMETARRALPGVSLRVVTGSGNPSLSEIQKRLWDGDVCHCDLDDRRMVAVMAECQAGLAAAGQTLFEAACLGLPLVTLAVADNQRRNGEAFGAAGVHLHAGFWTDTTWREQVFQDLCRLNQAGLRQKLGLCGQRCVDGQGPRRLAQRMLARGG